MSEQVSELPSGKFVPEAFRRKQQENLRLFGPDFYLLVERARLCLMWHMPPEYYDSMTQAETTAWITAWNQLQEEAAGNH